MIKADKLSKSYQDKIALKEVSFEVTAGEIFCLLGQNGAGKTTTINIFLTSDVFNCKSLIYIEHTFLRALHLFYFHSNLEYDFY